MQSSSISLSCCIKHHIFFIMLYRAGDVAAEYVTLPLQMSPSGTRRPRVVGKSTNWTTVCGELDHHCLSCKPL